jgi:hypothetical protein
MMIVVGEGDLVQRTGDDRTGRMTPCAVCTVHVETRSAVFLVEPQNQGKRFISGLASKPLERFVSGLTSKPLRQFLIGLGLKTDVDGL